MVAKISRGKEIHMTSPIPIVASFTKIDRNWIYKQYSMEFINQKIINDNFCQHIAHSNQIKVVN